MAMLVVAVTATLVAGTYWRQSILLRQAENELAYAQAKWLIRGAIDWISLILREDARTSAVDHLGEPWAVPLADTRLNENDGRPAAYLAGRIQDEQAKLNLRNLVGAKGDIAKEEVRALGRLLDLLELESHLAEALAQRMLAALRAQAAGQPALALASLDDVLAVEGLDSAGVARLRPFVTVLPEATPVNGNTAAAEVLAAQIAELELTDARRLVAGRERTYFRDAADLKARLTELGTPGEHRLGVATRFFTIEGNLTYQRAQLRARALLRRDAGRVDLVWLQLG
jgi:general secretion pathway protein K